MSLWKIKTFTIIFLCVVLLLPSASAHSGGTDSNGGHTNHSTGEYHYHHGYPAHQHPDGVCPYAASTSDSSDSTLNKYVVEAVKQIAADEEAWRKENKYYLEMDHEELVKEYLSIKQSFETVKAQRDALYEDIEPDPVEEEKSFRERAEEDLTLDSLYKTTKTKLNEANEKVDELSIEVAELKAKNTSLETQNANLQAEIDLFTDKYLSIGIAVGIALVTGSTILAARNASLKRQLLTLRKQLNEENSN